MLLTRLYKFSMARSDESIWNTTLPLKESQHDLKTSEILLNTSAYLQHSFTRQHFLLPNLKTHPTLAALRCTYSIILPQSWWLGDNCHSQNCISVMNIHLELGFSHCEWTKGRKNFCPASGSQCSLIDKMKFILRVRITEAHKRIDSFKPEVAGVIYISREAKDIQVAPSGRGFTPDWQA